MWRAVRYLAVICLTVVLLPGCGQRAKVNKGDSGKLQVVCTMFPLYDWARIVGGEQAEVTMLMPPGVEAHSFAPKPNDLIRIHNADLFFYTGAAMEPWVDDMIRGIGEEKVSVVNTSKGVTLISEGGVEHADHSEDADHDHSGHDHSGHDHGGHDHGGHDHAHAGGYDPHIWLDLHNAQIMVDTIARAFGAADPANADLYRQRADAYIAQLGELDTAFEELFATCEKQTLMYGGHFPFRYFVQRYNLSYVSPYHGFSPDAEPTPRELARMVETMRDNDIRFLYHGELVDPRVARVIAAETDAELLLLHAAHNVSRDEFQSDVGYLDLMKGNVDNLKLGLECP